ncbi:MAG: DUF3857 domain-containing protein [Bacteroidota bacterium]
MKSTSRQTAITFGILLLGLLAPNIHAQVLKHSKHISLSNNTLISRESYLIQVNNQEERKLGEVRIPHSDDSNFEVLYAEVIDQKGQVVRKLKKKDVRTRSRTSYGSFYEDDLIAELDLFWNAYPYRIRYAYETTAYNFIYLVYWLPNVHRGLTPINSTLKLEVPEELELKVHASPAFSFTKSTADGKKVLTWELGTIKFASSEIFAPSYGEIVPSVIVAPQWFFYGAPGSLQSWTSYGDWYLELNKNSTALPETEKLQVNALIKGVSNKHAIVTKLYHYLQDHTTYVNVRIDLGGLKSYPAAYVCQNKYGDCKALTTYMKALLDHAGISSNYVLLDLGENSWVEPEVPGPQFNHILLAVPFENDTMWLENTSKAAPVGYLGTAHQNRFALWIEPERSQLISTPKMSNEEVLEQVAYQFMLGEKGNGTVKIKFLLHGKRFEAYSYMKEALPEDKLKQNINNRIPLKDFVLAKWELITETRDQKFCELLVEGTVANQSKAIADMTVIKPPVINLPNFEKPANRQYPVQVQLPVNKKVITRYDLSSFEPYTLELPDTVNEETLYGRYTYQFEQTDTSVIVTEQFTLNTGSYSLEQYPALFQFLKLAQQNQRKLALILKST